MERILKNKKILILIGLVFILILVMLAYSFTHNNKTPNIPPTPIDSENHEENPGDIYIRDENGNIKNVLVIDTDDYSLNMDLLGTWKEYLLPVDERDKYQAFMIPDKTSEAIPYFYILREKHCTAAYTVSGMLPVCSSYKKIRFFIRRILLWPC